GHAADSKRRRAPLRGHGARGLDGCGRRRSAARPGKQRVRARARWVDRIGHGILGAARVGERRSRRFVMKFARLGTLAVILMIAAPSTSVSLVITRQAGDSATVMITLRPKAGSEADLAKVIAN